MLLERIESSGLAHYSYLIGDRGTAVVIDPRRDIDVYIEKASQAGYHIRHVLETHRNEDYVIGSLELAARLDVEIWHADEQLDYRYGQAVTDGQVWQIGRFKLQALYTPGHTPGAMSYVLYDQSGAPWMVFTGDALFAGDVGRVDLMGMDRAAEMAGLLYDTLFQKLLPLGDGVIVCPAHGAGSACGSSIVDRPWTTIGIERQRNPRLQYAGRDEFIDRVAQKLEYPPYFRRMEDWNVQGPPVLGTLPVPTPLSPTAFDERRQKAVVLDTRSESSFGAAHVPQALSIWMGGLGSFAGWFLPDKEPILLVNETDDPMPAVRHLIRLGYDRVDGCLSGGMLAWHTDGLPSTSIDTVTVQDLCHRLDGEENLWVLDVRSAKELTHDGEIPGAHHIHITQLPQHLHEVSRASKVTVFCGSGLRAMIGASVLRGAGWRDLAVVLGGVSGWNSSSCPLQLEDRATV